METQKTILITGAAARIGESIARHFATGGWTVAVHYNTSKKEAINLAEDLTAKGFKAIPFQADLRDESACGALIPQVNDTLGPIHCLVNNASAFDYDSVKTASRSSWDLHMQVNLWAPFVLSQNFARQLPKGEQGNIINILDQRVWNLTPHYMTYTLSKTGLWTLTQTLALALAPDIRVNGIGPGPTLKGSNQTEEAFQNQQTCLPLQKGPEPIEIAKAIDFILSTPSLTGQMIALDGGQHMGWAFPSQSVSVGD
jgi:NAD(P)-dependent dehydrogenase (short-subunit alcohol dehydrogenase family)